VNDSQGRTLLDQNLNAKAKGDSESLDVSAKTAKSVMKELKKKISPSKDGADSRNPNS
jgi:hypothetical protein